MNALTLTAAVLWTFQPFGTIQEATKFMDALPATACAQVSWGPAETDAESAETEAALEKRAKEDRARRHNWQICSKFSEARGAVISDITPTAKVPGGLGWKKLESYASLLGRNPPPKNVWVCDCGYDPNWTIDATSYRVVSNRWVVTYRKEVRP